MKKCPKCSVDVYQEYCPLCGRSLGEPVSPEVNYPRYILRPNRKSDFVKKLFLFLTISIVLITMYVNIFTYSLY